MPNEKDSTLRKTITLPTRLWQQIEDFQFEARVKRDTDAVRQLIEMGLQAHQRAKAVPKKEKTND
jgi:hypothetical protein